MNLLAIKYHTCEQDQGEGILLVDIETETLPCKDRRGRRLYYCMYKQHIFSVEEHNTTIVKEHQAVMPEHHAGN